MDTWALTNRINDFLIPRILGAQMCRPGSPEDGGILAMDKGFAEPVRCASAADAMVGAYLSPASQHHGDETLLEAAIRLLDHLIRHVHADGTIDLLETNYHDATCIGFSIQVLAYTHRLLSQKQQKTPLEQSVWDRVDRYLHLGATGMKNGGFHTPNHRWVMASALSLCFRQLGDEECLAVAQQYLDEGIDCDEEGEYTERSAGIYDVVCNHSLMILATELDKPELVDCVLRNLDKIAHYIEPDGSVLTLNSRRQDYGKRLYPFKHSLSCMLALAQPHDPKDSRYLRVAGLLDFLLRQYEAQLPSFWAPQDAGNLVTHLLLRPELAQAHPAEPMPVRFHRFYPKAGVLRHRNGPMSLSLVRDNSTFMKLQAGELEMLVRLSASYYARGQFRAEAIEPMDNGYRMRYSYRWGYKKPLGKAAGTTVWADIPHHLRQEANMLTWTWEVTVQPTDTSVVMTILGDGCDRLPWHLECALRAGGILRTENGFVPGNAGNWVVHGGTCSYRLNNDEIHIQGGTHEHWYAANMRGSEPPHPDMFTVYATGFAPVDQKLVFTWNKSEA